MGGYVAGPFPSPPLQLLYISSFVVIPKKGQPGKWRLIVALSSPGGFSVNDGVDTEQFCLQLYIHVDNIIRMVAKYGHCALMANLTWRWLTVTFPSILKTVS